MQPRPGEADGTGVSDLCKAGEAQLYVDLDALAANYRLIAGLAGGAETAPVVKADAYGLGPAPVARRLWAEGARGFFVARVREGVALRAALGPARPATVWVFDGCPPGAAPALAAAELTPVLNSFTQIDDWGLHAISLGRRLAAALHIDTGMNRLGLRPEEARALAFAPDRLRPLDVELLVSHLACGGQSDHPMNADQLDGFAEICKLYPGVPRSLAASGGVFLGPDYHLEQVRPGISLYGGGPFASPEPRLACVATLKVPILQVRQISPGETIGYGADFKATQALRIAIVAAGYADGVLRSSSPGAYGSLDGQACPFVGRISMDLTALDVTDRANAQPGADIELIGRHVPLDEAARRAGTLSYEILTRISGRIARVYSGDVA
jgi:alanine racemase